MCSLNIHTSAILFKYLFLYFVELFQSNFCPDKKGVDKYDLPSNFQLMSESGEATAYILDSKVFPFQHIFILNITCYERFRYIQ